MSKYSQSYISIRVRVSLVDNSSTSISISTFTATSTFTHLYQKPVGVCLTQSNHTSRYMGIVMEHNSQSCCTQTNSKLSTRRGYSIANALVLVLY